MVSHPTYVCIDNRDIEFDLENEKERCLYRLSMNLIYAPPSDVQRTTQIFEHLSFLINGADSNDIVQGVLGDCRFLSALATMSTAKGLVEKFCVAVCFIEDWVVEHC